jgi:integrase/recombinase XerD
MSYDRWPFNLAKRPVTPYHSATAGRTGTVSSAAFNARTLPSHDKGDGSVPASHHSRHEVHRTSQRHNRGIGEAGKAWASYVGPERRCQLEGTTEYFTRVAKQWFTFAGCLPYAPLPPFSEQVEQYALTLQKMPGRAPATIDSYKKSVAAFFRHINPRHTNLDTLRLGDIHEYLAKLRASGQKNSSIASQCNALRSFFKHAVIMGWCIASIPLGIKSPRIGQYQGPARGPTWRDVRRLVRQKRDASPKELRTHAILLLLAIYGLRRSEVARLQLSDFDWQSETFIVRRAKNRGIQQRRGQRRAKGLQLMMFPVSNVRSTLA